MGSVKDLTVDKAATENEMGVGIFKFTDDYSVFDYGKMPDIIPNKGEALCRIAAYNFEQLKELGVKSHYRRIVSGNEMEVNLVRVLFPQKGELQPGMRNYLVPLEVIFRNSLPNGSSVFKRLDKGQTTIEQLGLDHMPEPGEKLEKPIMDVSTKLEPTDRYLTWDEAREIAALTEEQMDELRNTALKVNDYLNKKAASLGMEHADGKIEMALTPENELVVVDVLGTLDENRFLYNGFHLSKQVLRDYYKTTPWYAVIEKEKEEGKGHGEFTVPSKLPEELIELVSNMYKAVTVEWTGEKTWDVPSVAEVIEQYKAFLEANK
ncbi:MAG: phosphoribosylaminoimidazolesuccinocarboxamide synthase [Candidatus Diapherotrites archaeon]|uniref:Phosphoribosylaminoimidazole-succinocarboxamide synthase n=1 Tax=Candidatus Iainarchaeum sp. TaxID=3101447 RepID=A0A2D6M171_9ARCH|nr:phosphoribosylaminoimidazolesuccinocarboxamide synthase [Candidatus Diapherotrites archaeon]|tara:strand:- start:3856 stop:4818 length:963 start_codon:yes stop_codon:yes gene_type:complete